MVPRGLALSFTDSASGVRNGIALTRRGGRISKSLLAKTKYLTIVNITILLPVFRLEGAWGI